MKKKWIVTMIMATLSVFATVGCGETSSSSSSKTAPAGGGDRAFIDGMVPHHEMAVMMADDAIAKASHGELKAFAQKVKDDQSREIGQMKTWRQQWFGTSATPPMDHSGMKPMPTGPEFDRMWMEEMIRHHQSGIDMATRALSAAARPETKELAQQIIDAQMKEQAQLRGYLKVWYNK